MRSAAFTLAVIVAAPLYAQFSEITPFIGIQSGGSMSVNNRNTPLDVNAAYGLTATWDWTRNSKLDVLVSHQETSATRKDPFEPTVTVDASITYFDIGGRYVFDPVSHAQGYIAFTTGVSLLSVPGGQGLAWNFAAGGGLDLHMSQRTALRLDGRFHTSFGGRGSISCSSIGGVGTCSGFSSGSGLVQFTASAGLVYHFH